MQAARNLDLMGEPEKWKGKQRTKLEAFPSAIYTRDPSPETETQSMKRLSAERVPAEKKSRKTRKPKDETYDKQYRYIIKRLSEAFPDLKDEDLEGDDNPEGDDLEDIESDSDDESANREDKNNEGSRGERLTEVPKESGVGNPEDSGPIPGHTNVPGEV